MRLIQWVKQQGRGELARLTRVTGLSYQAVHAIAHGRVPSYDSASRISKATISADYPNGAVSIAEICEVPKRRARTTTAPTRINRRRRKATVRAVRA